MKLCIFLLLLLTAFFTQAQPPAADSGLTGVYRVGNGLNLTFEVYVQDNQLMVQIIGQGTTTLKRLSPLVYRAEHVQPKATMVFLRDSTGRDSEGRITTGRVSRMRWTQVSRTFTWKRLSGKPESYAGDFKLAANAYRILHLSERGGQLIGHIGGEPDKDLLALGKDRFELTAVAGKHLVVFKRDKQGLIHELAISGDDIVLFDKTSPVLPHVSNRVNGFTRADTLLGMLTPLRSCYDVLFYDLDMTLFPETRSIQGSNAIRFRAVTGFDRLQVDLHDNLVVDKILYHGQELAYTRECHAIFVQFPATVQAGSIDSFRVQYSGEPLEPDFAIVRGGIFWLWDRNADAWIESVSQGVGANVFWPCKDHLSDRPDSMRISVTIPGGLEEISNGRRVERTELPGGQTRFVWYVDYPIVTYDVAINIGNYVHFTDLAVSGKDSLPMNFYALRYNSEYAHWLFGDIKRMLALYEKDFGPYPFARDGFNILESIYPMEHQGAISIGHMNQPFNSHSFDSSGELRTMWHESSHEWWGNSVGCRDYADMWIHEGFATYAEFLNEEAIYGRDSAKRELTKDHPDNKIPIIGVYNVNHFHTGDMYLKGALMLETLRDVIGNDSLWFGIFRGIQARFRYQPVTTEDIAGYFSQATGTDYTYFFDQYLRYPAIPVLVLAFHSGGGLLKVDYKWETDVSGFRMPVKVTVAKDSMAFIYPTTNWQTLELGRMTAGDFRVDTTDFYVGVRVQ
jgi:hypothetical protein